MHATVCTFGMTSKHIWVGNETVSN